jgi:hypothetical protein
MPEKNNHFLPGYDSIVSSLYNSYRASSGTLDPDLLESGLIKKINSSLTTSDNVSNFIHAKETINTYRTKFAASFDSIFSPYTTYLSASGTPKFEQPTSLGVPNSLTLNPFNPNNSLSLYYAPTGSLLYSLSSATTGAPTAAELALQSGTAGWMNYGHNISWSTYGTGQWPSYGFDDSFIKKTGTAVEVENIRAVGFRAPMVLSGWGWDIDGNPVPSERDDRAVRDVDDGTKFGSGAFSDPSLWKTGPVDLRWDYNAKVWTGNSTRIYLCKATNTINTSCFSYEVERDNTLAQYTRNTLGGGSLGFDATANIYDPQQVAYDADAENIGCRVNLDYGSIQFPMYEAFIIRQTVDPAGPSYYNLFSDDCSDCGSIINRCGGTGHDTASAGKKVLIENPLLQQIDVGTLLFTVNTGRTKKINTGEFIGGSGENASGNLVIASGGGASIDITAGGSGYTYGAFALLPTGAPCVDITLTDNGDAIAAGTPDPTTGVFPTGTFTLTIIPNNAVVDTEELPIHWIINSQKFNSTVVTHVECQGGQLTKMTRKIQTEFQTCEIPAGANTCAINSF